MKDKIIIVLLVCIIFLFIVVGFGISKLTNNNNNYLIDSNKDIVFDHYKNEEFDQTIPHVNIKNVDTEINNSIDEFMQPYMGKNTVTTNYHYHINGSIFTLFIFITDDNNDYSPFVHFKEYHVNLKKLKVLTNDDILNMYNYKEDEIIEQLNNKFKKFYEDERRKNVISRDISYEKYLNMYFIKNWKDIIHYDVIDKELYACIEYFIFPENQKYFYMKKQGVGYCFKVPIE